MARGAIPARRWAAPSPSRGSGAGGGGWARGCRWFGPTGGPAPSSARAGSTICPESGCMVEGPAARSPLMHIPAPAFGDGLTLREIPFLGLIDLRIDPRDKGAWGAAESALVATLPEANRSADRSAGTVLWLGPDEFLVVTEPGREAALAA